MARGIRSHHGGPFWALSLLGSRSRTRVQRPVARLEIASNLAYRDADPAVAESPNAAHAYASIRR